MAESEDIVLASSVSNIPFIKVFDEMVRDRYNGIDLTPLVTYLIDFCPAQSLYWLADQFDVLSAGEFDLATDDQDKRNLIKNAIAIHRKMGTPWAIRTALLSLGFAQVVIQEGGNGSYYDGTHQFDGSINYDGGASWAIFKVQILDLGETKGWSTVLNQTVINVITKYKRAVCTLEGIGLVVTLSDNDEQATESEVVKFSLNLETFQETFQNFGIVYDGEFLFDGSKLYGANSEVFLFNMTPLLDQVPAHNLFSGDYTEVVVLSGSIFNVGVGIEFVSLSNGYLPFNFRAGVSYIISFTGGPTDTRDTLIIQVADQEYFLNNFADQNLEFFADVDADKLKFSFTNRTGRTAYMYYIEIQQVPTLGLDIFSLDDSNFTLNIVYSSDPTIDNEDGSGAIENESGAPINSE